MSVLLSRGNLMAQWNPLDDLMFLQDRMNRLFEDASQRRASEHPGRAAGPAATDSPADVEGVETADWYPAADVYEDNGEYIVAVDLPGIDRSTLDISIDDDRLTVKGKRDGNDLPQQLGECPKGNFLRTFSVPASVDQKDIRAEYKDGVLKIRLPRQPERKAQRIEIKVS
ncbi:MAG: Hsp20/alpha crystallin family protein [Pyrinomonadaceae bacterium]|nr:Hsp20/alpha crystallin family protein [Pyrinomonadaceae bacterium]